MIRFVTSPNKLGLSLILSAGFLIAAMVTPERTTAKFAVRDIESVANDEKDALYAIAENVPLPPENILGEYESKEQVDVETIVDGIDGPLFVCGNELSTEESREHLLSIVANLAASMDRHRLKVSPMGILSTMLNESRFDTCALGTHPRKWAQKNGLLRKNIRSISYTKGEILGVIDSPSAKRHFRKSGFDLGLCQVLSRFYDGDNSDMLDLSSSVDICVIEMKYRSELYRTKTPWLYWRGTRTDWYQRKIRRLAKRIGATRDEIADI